MKDRIKARRITGFCANKQCEGTKPKSFSGQPLRICTSWEWCVCDCHKQITKMYADLGMDREPPEQSHDYLEHLREQQAKWDMPSLFDMPPLEPLSNAGGTDTPPDTSDPSSTPPRAAERAISGAHGTVTTPQQLTPTGRRAKGSLELDVLAVCTDYMNNIFDWEYCTPRNVADEIGKRHAVEPPSTGAINAVWDRWEKLGFATQDKKPSRLVKFDLDASEATLAMLKARAKRDKKRVKSEIKRGVRAPQPR